MISELVTLLDRTVIGRLKRAGGGRLSFTYDEAYRGAQGARPLSLSMPLAQAEHGHRIVEAFLWGLLPDNELILGRWAKRFETSARNVFGLLSHVGEDCAGAVRFVAEPRVATIAADRGGRVQWLEEAEVATRLRALSTDISAWRRADDAGQFSLAGAQSKTALLFDGTRWGIPSGRTPTTHILKPGALGLPGHTENEHFCLALAKELGLGVASSRVMRCEEQLALVVTRYDRVRIGRGLVRAHQEDVCQALGVLPQNKYQSDGGPSARAVAALLREHSQRVKEDLDAFVDALAYNFLIAGTDGHAKNYSLLIGAGGRARLAPLYDVASALAYDEPQVQKLKLAMSIGGKYRLREVGRRQWQKLAGELGLGDEAVRARVLRMAEALPDASADVLRAMRRERLRHPVLGKLELRLPERAKRCAAALGA